MNEINALKMVADGRQDEAIELADLLKANNETRKSICEIHGEFESKHIFGRIWSQCPTCNEEHAEEKKRQIAENAAKQRELMYQAKLGGACIPERFKDRTLDLYVAKNEGQKQALAFAKLFAVNFEDAFKTGRSAIFCGKPGTGKTHLAIGIGLHIISQHSVLFSTVQRIVRRIKDSWRKDANESESDVINLFAYPDLLIIDEIGVQFGSEFEKNALFDILNERYENRRPTILLSNLTQSEVNLFLGDRVFDRLREDGGKCIAFDWESHRGQSREE